ncbi:Gfo/Idh/MocA family protein [Lichenifustis flavocetrariae]|uniref:Gfo/Idh/MocA family oxidoreductase n=1 Tax=Lichenifustis flavocetrariae TaxID=2949735 RepID=A0AA41Z009_9HYPH|nr:Gfo/Idh/MocA family oxidoreductase [Lichenifustis flavocetrariae]MCW6510258.1 Gfo/Idh/MocA family oxidoreductase [Lichenifustis flavocetrariae]
MSQLERRRFIQVSAGALAGAAWASTPAASAPEIDSGRVAEGKVTFPSWTATTERPSGGPPNPLPLNERIGFAVVGLGRLALEEILPAFAEAKQGRLVGLVSGTPEKAKLIAAQYGVDPQSIYGYTDFEALRSNRAIQIVYVVTPNALHKEYVIGAVGAGKHVLCEKPMATGSADAQAMVDAAAMAGRTLMIAYRSQYEPHNRAVQKIVREKPFGPVGLIDAINTQNMAAPQQWRLKKALAGGGALPDIGLYCLNGARFMSGEEPIEIFGRTWSAPNDERFGEVEESVSFMLRFPSGLIANCFASYGLHEARRMGLHAPGASVNFENAFAYTGHRLTVAHREGEAESVDERRLAAKNQFALEIDHMAECVRTGRKPRTPGEEGVQDHKLMEAIYRSAESGQPVKLDPVETVDATRGPILSDE